MTSARGIVGIIGVRAEIIGVRQFLADGREIDRTIDRITGSELKLQAASAKAVAAQSAADASRLKANASFGAAIQARQKLLQLETQLASAQKIANGPATGLVGTNGSPISSGAAALAAADVTRLQKELKLVQDEFDRLGKVAIQAGRVQKATSAQSVVAIEAENRAKLEQIRLEEQLVAARRSRLNAATTAIALPVAAAIAVTAGASIVSAAKYQQELSKINVLTSTTDEETKQLGAEFLKLSTQIPISAADQAEAAYLALSSGIKSVPEALDLVTGASKAAVAGQGDVKDIVKATIAVLNGYPKGAITASQANDILFAGVKEGAAEFDDFAGSIGKLIPIAAALGVPFDQLTASLAVLTNGGLSAEEAATGLRAILNDLAKDENSKQAQEALAEFGLTVSDLRKKIRDEGLPQAMGELITLFNGNLAAIEPIIPNIRGMVAAFSAFSNGGKTTIGVLSAIDNAGGIVDQSFAKTKDNVANLAQIVSNQLNVALIEIGSAVLPEVTKQLQGLIQWISANKDAIASFVSEGLQLLAQIVSDVAKGFETLRGALANIVGQSDSTKAALAAIGLALAWALPGGPYLKGLALILTLIGQIQSTKIDLPLGLGSIGGRGTELQILKENQKELQQELNDLNSSGPGGIKGKILDIVTSLPGPLHNQPSQNIQENPELAAARANIQKKLAENSAAITKEEQKEADAKKTLDDATKPLTNITLPEFKTNVDAVDHSAKQAAEDALKAAKELQNLAQEFQKTSEAAGQVESLTAKLKLFGEITPEIAKAFGLNAVQAGNVQGVDAVARATERATNRAFEFTKALATVAQALQDGSAAAVQAVREIVHGIASAALEASQSALSALLSQPTVEVANLNVPLAQQHLTTATLSQQNNPAIYALQQQLRNIDKQISAQNRANQIANRAAQRQREQQQKAQQAAQRAQQQAQEAEANARKLANLQAQIAAERQLAALQKLIDANNRAASDLQKAFIKSNNDLQVQINTAIGKGDSATALALVEKQRQATKAYRENSLAIQNSTESLTTQLHNAQEAEAERQRQQQLADAQFEAQKKQTDAIDTNTDSTSDNTDAQDAQTQALEDSKQAIQDQIDALQAPIDASKQQEQTIQDSIAVYEAQTALIKAQGVAADKTLKTQAQQKKAAEELIKQIGVESAAVEKFSKLLGIDSIKAINDANDQFRLLQGILKTITDPSSLIAQGFDPASKLAEIFKVAITDPVAKISVAGDKLKDAANAQLAAVALANQQHAGQNEAFQLQQFGPVISDDVLRRAGLLKDILSSIKPPDVGDAGLATIQASTTAAQALGATLALEVRAPDVGDAGQQTINNATTAAQTLGFTLATQVNAPDIGDAGRQTILDATQAARGLGTVLANIANQASGLGKIFGNLAAQANNIKPPKFPGFATGGYFTKPTLGIIGEAGPEVVLPLNNVKRISQILAQASSQSSGNLVSLGLGALGNSITSAISSSTQGLFGQSGSGASGSTGGQYSPAVLKSHPAIVQIPPSITTALLSRSQVAPIFAPNITVTGQTLDTMEATTIRAVQRAFRDARVVSGRSGGLITTGLGPSH